MATIPTRNNPAARLLNFVGTLRGYAINNKTQKTATALSIVLGIREDDVAGLLERVGKILGVPREIREQVRSIKDVDQNLYLRWLETVEMLLAALNLNASIAMFADRLPQAILDEGQFCADLLSRTYPERVIASDQLRAVRKEVEDLKSTVVQSELDLPLKRYLIEHLRAIVNAIDLYDILGPSEIEATLNRTLGSVLTDLNRAERIKESSVGNRFWEVVLRVSQLVEIGSGLAQIVSRVSNLQLPHH